VSTRRATPAVALRRIARLAVAARRSSLVAVTAVLAGCAPMVPREPVAAADATALAAPFDVDGRISARRGREGGAASFTWHHAGTADEIDLATPLGQTLARLRGDADGVRATWPDGRVVDAPDWDALTARILGVPIPVQGLGAWLRGFTHPGSPGAIERDARGRPALLRQDGWEIVYGYPDDTATRASRLTLRYDGADPAEVRLVIDRWP
jgi:outer membrane lipoprotein LolB